MRVEVARSASKRPPFGARGRPSVSLISMASTPAGRSLRTAGPNTLNAVESRSRIKLKKAIRGATFAPGDCCRAPIQKRYGSSVPDSFESAIGTRSQLTTN
jgi:hypothetical protein